MIKNNKSGFTLVELLAVIIILGLVGLIAIPSITKVVKDSRKKAYTNSIKGILRAIDYKKYDDEDFDPSIIDETNIDEELDLANDNYKSISINYTDDETTIIVYGKNEWNNLVAYGTKKKMYLTEEDLLEECYTIDEATNTILRYDLLNSDCPIDVLVPSEINGVEIQNIGASAFRKLESQLCYDDEGVEEYDVGLDYVHYEGDGYCECEYRYYSSPITNVIFSDGIKSIGEAAFYENELTNLIIPNSVTTIGIAAFTHNRLTSIRIPNNITTISGHVFADNLLTSVSLPSSVTSIGQSAFSNNQLTSITIPSSVTTIGNRAFYGNQLTSAIISNNVTSIDSRAFQGNKLTNIVIPSSVTFIGYIAFYENQLISITMQSANVTVDYVLESYYNYFKNAYLSGGAGTYIGTQNGTWTKQ